MSSEQTPQNLRARLTPALAGHVCLHAAMTGMRMSVPLMTLALGYGTLAAGIVAGLFAVTQIFMSIPVGRYADRHGLKRPMAISITVASLGVALSAAWPVYGMLCVTAVLCGGAVGGATIVLQRYVGRLAQNPTELRQAFSWMSVAPAASNFLGPFVAGLMIDHFSYRAAFALLACFPILAWLLLRRARELPGEPQAKRPAGAAWDLLRGSEMQRLLLMGWFMNVSWDMHAFMVPVLGHERGLPASVIGAILGSFAVAAALVRFLLPLIAHRVKEWVLITCATALAGLMFACYPLAPSAWGMGVFSSVLGMALGAIQPMILAMLHQITPRERQGEALAVRLVIVNVSNVGMPLLFGLGGGLFGAATVFWAMGLIVGFGSRAGLRLKGMGDHPPGH